MIIHSITKTYKFFFRKAPYKSELLASLLDLALVKIQYDCNKKINKRNVLAVGLIGLLCVSTVKKRRIRRLPRPNKKYLSLILQSNGFGNLLKLSAIGL